MDFINDTAELASIKEYTGLSFREIIKLPLGELLLYRRDAWISKMKRTSYGRELLKNLWRLQQTESDDKAVEEFNKERS